MVERGPRLVVLHSDWVQVVPEPNGGHHSASVAERNVATICVRVLVRNELRPAQVLVGRGDNFHHILVRFEAARFELTPVSQRVERPDAFLADFPYFRPETDFVNLMGEVVIIGLHINAMGGNVEVTGDLGKCECLLQLLF